jgi:hypothetical protein
LVVVFQVFSEWHLHLKTCGLSPSLLILRKAWLFFSLETLRVSALAGRFFLLLLAGRRGE